MSEVTGRPTVMTPETISKLEEAFLLGCSDIEACLYADIGKSTLYNYQEVNPEFVERKEKLKENPVLLARTSVVNKVSTDADLALRFLERKKRDEFSTKQESDTTIKGDLKHNHAGKIDISADLIASAIEKIMGKNEKDTDDIQA